MDKTIRSYRQLAFVGLCLGLSSFLLFPVVLVARQPSSSLVGVISIVVSVLARNRLPALDSYKRLATIGIILSATGMLLSLLMSYGLNGW
jgi:hypothetical protein